MSALSAPVRRFCKDILSQYPLLKKELKALEEEKQLIYEEVPVATWRNEVRIKAIGEAQSGKLFRLMRLEEQWREVAFYVRAVDDLLAYLEQIKPDYKRLVELYFFEGKQAWQVAEELAIGERTMYHWLRDITRLFAHRLGLCSAG